MDPKMVIEFLRQTHKTLERTWIEKQCFRDLLLAKKIATAAELDALAEKARLDPREQEIARQNFAGSRHQLMELGVDAYFEGPFEPPRGTGKPD